MSVNINLRKAALAIDALRRSQDASANLKPLAMPMSDDELRQFFLDVVDRKPEQHDFRNNYKPGRKMVAIGG